MTKGKTMKGVAIVAIVCLAAEWGIAAGIVVQNVQGDVSVRYGVTESWSTLKAGTELGPEATIRTGDRSTAQLRADDKMIRLPAAVIVDLVDIRDLSQEELLLKLTMEKVRQSPDRRRAGGPDLPNAAVTHGTDAGHGAELQEDDVLTGYQLLKGAQVLFDNEFFSTCVLKTMDVVRRYPSLNTFSTGWLVAESLERAGLKGEALRAFTALAASAREKDEQDRVQAKLSALKSSH
jgi:hypothetical protein